MEIITNTAELREFLLQQMRRVSKHEISGDEVDSIVRLSEQVTRTLALEIRAVETRRITLGEPTPPNLQLTNVRD